MFNLDKMLTNASTDDYRAVPMSMSPSNATLQNLEANSDHGSQYSANQAHQEYQENARRARNRAKKVIFMILFVSLLVARTD